MKKLSFAVISCLLVSSAAFATQRDDASSGLWAAWQADQQIQSDLQDGLLNSVAKQALDILVAQGVQNLRDVGETALADQYQREWQNQISLYLEGKLSRELYDHDPLSPWLANFYDTLMVKTHGLAKAVQLLSDINAMNYALGVVLKPDGTWRQHTSYDRIEYRKHFIPFADIVTYWVTLEACNYYAGDFSDLCSYGADYLDHLMGRYVAADISDQVWHSVTGEPIPPLPVPPHPPGNWTEQAFQAHVLRNFR